MISSSLISFHVLVERIISQERGKPVDDDGMCGEEHEILVSPCSSRSSTTSPKLLPAFFLVQPVTCCFVVKKIVIPKCSLFRTPISAVIFCGHGLFGDWVGLVDARWRRTGASLHPIDTSRWKTQSRNLFSCSCPVCAQASQSAAVAGGR